ncbi:inner centromere protein [Scaptodrosophila lebanonensis]|uniref:Inner centromere protein n=1 Tax=Drosophila lebanonensis TaxID=7225 RepID=A0A6J2TTT8_DROLE|nr:inner centromere protein [Scaptodrosophila lebanonensis]
MEDLLKVLGIISNLKDDLNTTHKKHFEELDELFFGVSTPAADATGEQSESIKTSTSVTPQQTKKRPKRLSSLTEEETDSGAAANDAKKDVSLRTSVRVSNSQLLAAADDVSTDSQANTTAGLMPPPPAPADTTLSSGRPQRAAKLRSEKNLKEPSLNSKMRRPTTEDLVKVKLEHEHRQSQFETASFNETDTAPTPLPSTEVSKPVDEIVSDDKEDNKSAREVNTSRDVVVKIKREKLSNGTKNEDSTPAPVLADQFKVPLAVPLAKALPATSDTDESTVLSVTATTNTTTTSAPAKKGRKKKEAHRPIKIERFSDLEKGSPISSRTRRNIPGKRNSEESQPPQRSIYEDAIENLPNGSETRAEPAAQGAVNETVTISNATMILSTAPGDATFNLPQGNATITLGKQDATFAVENDTRSSDSSNKTMETAKDTSSQQPQRDSLMTEDDSVVDETPPVKTVAAKKVVPPPKSATVKPLKMPTRTHELFNPLLQSPVKMRVEAFENAANAQTGRPKRTKELMGTPSSGTTPTIGKLPAPTLGRFLTPTQTMSAGPLNSAQPKKAPLSACKATTLMKTATGTNLKSTNSSSTKTLSRENSGDDFRKGLHQLAEERKKQREQKHLLAAQQREAKERERAERMAKLAKEREEKRIKKVQEQERKKQEHEMQLKLRQQEEAEALKKAKAKAIQEQERAMLLQMKQDQLNSAKSKQIMMPPPPKSKYTFEMLHEDDSTDDEGKVTYKRPPPPTWSRSHVRNAALVMQSYCPTDVIDSFFSVAPTTPDLKLIFPNIDPRQLKRNSSVLWSTPPRYSELPKY